MNRPPIKRPCRLCGTGTTVPDRICWPCRRCAHDAETAAGGPKHTDPTVLRPLWGLIVARHLLRSAVTDRARCGLTPLSPKAAIVIEFERPDGASRFATLTAQAFDQAGATGLHEWFGLGPPGPGARTRIHDGRELFGPDIDERLHPARNEP